MSLRSRLILCLLVPLAVTAALTAVVSVRSLLQAQAELTDARYRFVAGQLRSAIENGLTLGLHLEDLRQTSELLGRIAARDPDIAAILVFDDTGTVRYGTDAGRVGDLVPSTWRYTTTPTAVAVDDDRPGGVIVAPLFNTYGDEAGGLALRYGQLGETVRTEQTVAVVGGLAFVLGAAAAIFSVLAAGACLAGPRQTLAALSARFAALAADPGCTNPDPRHDGAHDDVREAGRAFEGRTAAAWRNIAERQADIERLDELA